MHPVPFRTSLSVLLALALGAAAPLALAQQTTPAATADAAADGLEEAAPEAAPAAEPAPAPRRADAADPAPADPSLLPVFRQFGEREGLVALMEVFMEQLLADPRTRPFFENADQVRIKQHLVEQFCVILGGPCQYTGRDMKSAHEGMGVDRAAFNALVEDLQIAMDRRKVPFRAQNQLLARLAPMHREIEGK